MSDFQKLKQETQVFFEKHRDRTSDVRSFDWAGNGPWQGPVPHHDKAGVYALGADGFLFQEDMSY